MHYEVHALYSTARNSAADIVETLSEEEAKQIAYEMHVSGKYASVSYYQVFCDEPNHLLP